MAESDSFEADFHHKATRSTKKGFNVAGRRGCAEDAGAVRGDKAHGIPLRPLRFPSALCVKEFLRVLGGFVVDSAIMERLDLRGLKCPLPALFAKRALRRAPPGEAIEVIADDPLASIDIPHMCAQEGFEFVSVTKDVLTTRLILRRPA